MANHSSAQPKHGAHFANSNATKSETTPAAGKHSGAASQSERIAVDVPTIQADPNNPTLMGTGAMSSRTIQATLNASTSAPRVHGDRAQKAQAALGADAKGKKRGRSSRSWIGAIIAVVIFAALGFGIYKFVWPAIFGDGQQSGNGIESGKEVTITIADGSGASTIVQQLLEAGVIDDANSFSSLLLREGADAKLKPGTYVFLTGSPQQNVIDLLVAGPNSSAHGFTVPEGMTVKQVAALVEESLGISADEFLAAAKASNYASDFPFLSTAAGNGYDSVEGYLFPKTYSLDGTDVTADNAIRAMLTQYSKEVEAMDLAAGEASISDRYGVTLNDYEVLTLASIVEREALTDEQRPLIASVFLNRLKQGMYLQSDATIAYETGGTDPDSDLSVESPYNTYLNAGLPPTPVCSPSAESIQAVINPADTNYLYFWITEDAEQFSETWEEHQNSYNAYLSSK